MKQKKKKGNEDLANILPHTPVPESANKNTRRRKKKIAEHCNFYRRI